MTISLTALQRFQLSSLLAARRGKHDDTAETLADAEAKFQLSPDEINQFAGPVVDGKQLLDLVALGAIPELPVDLERAEARALLTVYKDCDFLNTRDINTWGRDLRQKLESAKG